MPAVGLKAIVFGRGISSKERPIDCMDVDSLSLNRFKRQQEKDRRIEENGYQSPQVGHHAARAEIEVPKKSQVQLLVCKRFKSKQASMSLATQLAASHAKSTK